MPGEKAAKPEREELIRENLGLVYWAARRWQGVCQTRGLDWEDLCQVGMVGLIKAADSFRPELGCRFSTYAVPMIMGELRRSLRDGGLVHVSRGYKELGQRIRRAAEDWQRRRGEEATIGQLAAALGVAQEKIAEALAAGAEPVYLQDGAGEQGELLEQLAAAEPGEEEWVRRIDLQAGIGELPERLQYLIRARFFQEQTQAAVAERLGVSQVQVSRLEKRALAMLREYYQGVG